MILFIIAIEVLTQVQISSLTKLNDNPKCSEFMVVVYNNHKRPECTGTLITPKFVLTYCKTPQTWSNWKLVLDVYSNPYSQERNVKSVAFHMLKFNYVDTIEADYPFLRDDPQPVKVVSLKKTIFRKSWEEIQLNIERCYLIYLEQDEYSGDFYFRWINVNETSKSYATYFTHNIICLDIHAQPYEPSLTGAPLFCNNYYFATLIESSVKKANYTFWLIDNQLNLFNYNVENGSGNSAINLKSEGTQFETTVLLILIAYFVITKYKPFDY